MSIMFSALRQVFLFAPLFLPSLQAASLQPRGLNPNCAPGGNFDLSVFLLELPFGKTSAPNVINTNELQGCSGYQDAGHHYFFTESGDGALVMKVPGSPAQTGCVTWPDSKHCRTELKELNSWDPKAQTNRLAVTLAVPQPDNSGHGTVIGQIHIDNNVSIRPVAELYFNQNGDFAIGVEKTRAGGNLIFTWLASIPVGSKFSYEIRYESDVLQVLVNGNSHTLSTNSLDSPLSYFKVGNYNQGDSPSDIHFFGIKVSH
jgi:hypothetical protein